MQWTPWTSGAVVALCVTLLAAPAQAHPESAAPDLRADVVSVGHAPQEPAPGTQWQGHVEFASGTDVAEVRYQICRVGQECFAQPTYMQRNGTRFLFDTASYGDPPIRWGVGDGQPWHVGYKFVLTHQDGNLSKFPKGLAVMSDECRALSNFDCDATNYFVFVIPGAKATKDVPAPLLFLPLLAALMARRDRHG